MVKQVPDANPLKSLLKRIEHLAAHATTYRYQIGLTVGRAVAGYDRPNRRSVRDAGASPAAG